MLIKKESYETFKKSNSENSLLANHIKEDNCDYYTILDNENNINSFYLYKNENWLAINIHDKKSIFDNEDIMKSIFDELKKEYKYIIIRIDTEFKNIIEKAYEYGFVLNKTIKQGEYTYFEMKKSL